MKSRKLLALFLAIFMLASLIVPASAETITPETNVTNGIVGYDPALVEKVDFSDTTKYTSITNYAAGAAYLGYTISSVDEFYHFDSLITTAKQNLAGVKVYLTADLDFSKESTKYTARETENDVSKIIISPIGKENGWNPAAFAGVFDGQGYSIKNVIVRPETATTVGNGFFGLFGAFSGTVGKSAGIKNLVIDSSVTLDPFKTITGADVTTMITVGGLIGTIQGFTSNSTTAVASTPTIEIYNVCNNTNITYNSGTAAGLVAFAKMAIVKVTNCTNAGNVTQKVGGTTATGITSFAVGGLIGGICEPGQNKGYYSAAEIVNCRNTGTISTNHTKGTLGGILGGVFAHADHPARSLKIENCINNGDVVFAGTEPTIPVDWIAYAGILGFCNNTAKWTVTINGCKNYGTINANDTIKYDADKNPVVDQETGEYISTSLEKEISTQGTETNCVEAAGTPDPTYNMVAKYYQMSNKTYKNTEDADCYSLRLVALHNGKLDVLDSYSYTVTIKYGTDSVVTASTGELTSVRTEIAVDDKLGTGVTKISASTLGADYVSAVCINNIPTSIGAIEVTIVPTMTKGETTTTAAPITFTVDPAVYNAQ